MWKFLEVIIMINGRSSNDFKSMLNVIILNSFGLPRVVSSVWANQRNRVKTGLSCSVQQELQIEKDPLLVRTLASATISTHNDLGWQALATAPFSRRSPVTHSCCSYFKVKAFSQPTFPYNNLQIQIDWGLSSLLIAHNLGKIMLPL